MPSLTRHISEHIGTYTQHTTWLVDREFTLLLISPSLPDEPLIFAVFFLNHRVDTILFHLGELIFSSLALHVTHIMRCSVANSHHRSPRLLYNDNINIKEISIILIFSIVNQIAIMA